MSNGQVMTVGEINMYIKDLLQGDSLLRSLWVKGEISNFKAHSSGHLYFSLKDATGTIKCVMFRSYASRLNFKPEHGMAVVAMGNVSVYERDGVYQLYVEEMLVAGVGALHIAYEKLKQKLEAEGLFAQQHKRPLPYLAQTIGIVTSPTGAAIRDMVSVIRRRNPKINIRIIPAAVQGVEGIASICRGLDAMYAQAVDVIIVGRGGGSLEELWCFNEEAVVRKIAASPVPIISAVGHETDFTSADFAADMRAATPSMAAELAAVEWVQLESLLNQQREQLIHRYGQLMERRWQRLQLLSQHPVLSDPQRFLQGHRQYLDQLSEGLVNRMERRLLERQNALALACGQLEALSPLKVLARGYAVCADEQGTVVTDAQKIDVGQGVKVTLKQGKLYCRVENKEVENHG